MKTCPKCGEEKPLNAFHRDPIQKNGRHPYCKVCKAAITAARRAANPERARAQARAWIAANPDKKKISGAKWRAKNAGHTTKWAQQNKARHQELQRKWRIANPDKIRAGAQRHYAQNKDRHKAVGKRWQIANPQKLTEIANRRRARKIQAMPAWLSAIQLAQIQEHYEIAAALTCQTGVKHHVDHIHPLIGRNFRGLHVPWNLQVITATENHRKGRRLLALDGGDNR